LLRRFVLTLLVVLLIAKVIGVVARGPSPLVLDAGHYWELGGRVAQGDVLLFGAPIAFRTPGYPWLVGAVRAWLPAPLLALVVLQGALWLGTVGLAGLLAQNLSGRRQAMWMVLGIAVVMLSSVTYTATVLTETLFTFLLIAHLWTVHRFVRVPSTADGVWVGLSLGLLILTRPIGLLVWVADVAYLIAHWRSLRGVQPEPGFPSWGFPRRGWIGLAAAVAVTSVCLAPWMARNHALFDRVMLTEFVGRNVWIVTFQGGSGARLDWPDSASAERLQTQVGDSVWKHWAGDESWRQTWTVSNALTASGLSDPTADRLMKRVAVDAISESPVRFARRATRRWINFWRTRATDLPPQAADLSAMDRAAIAARWGPTPFAGETVWGVPVAAIEAGLRLRWSNWLAGNTLLLLVIAASVGWLLWHRKSRPAGLWLAMILGYVSGVTAVLEIPDYRYRLILEPVVLVAVVAAIAPSLFASVPQAATRSDA
jgi:hypothetical protein